MRTTVTVATTMATTMAIDVERLLWW
jgi:hypothetical protein